MKRILPIILVLVLLILPMNSSAANEVFVGINNAMLSLTNAMPTTSGGVWYMDYMDFTRGDLGISASYNKDLGTVVLYNWDTTLVFNVNNGTVKNGNTEYSQRSFSRNGTIYVPAAFVCEQFGITFSYLSEVSTIRLRTSSSMSDSMFVYIAKNRIPYLLAAYNESYPSTPGIGSSTTDQSTRSQTVYITIDAKDANNLSEIDKLLSDYNMGATFFLSQNALSDGNLIRKISARHSVGIYADSISQATTTNDALFLIAQRKSRLLRSDTVLSDAQVNGYRQWGTNVDGRTLSYSQIANRLEQRNSTVLRFDNSDASLTKLKRVLSGIFTKKYTVRTLDVIMTPVEP